MKEHLIETKAGSETPTNQLSEILLKKLYYNKEYQNATKSAIEIASWKGVLKSLTIVSVLSIAAAIFMFITDAVREIISANDNPCMINETANEEYCKITEGISFAIKFMVISAIALFVFWSLYACFFSELSTEKAEENLEKLQNDTTPGCCNKMLRINAVSRAKDPVYHLESEKLLAKMEQNEQNPISNISTQAYTKVQKITSDIKNHF